MTLEDFQLINFGICFRIGDEIVFHRIPIDDSVRKVLVDMRNQFSKTYDEINSEVEEFSPAEKYASVEKLRANLNQPYLSSLNNLFHRNNAQPNNIELGQYLAEIEFYYAEFIHNNGAKTIGVKRPNQFKALLQKKLVRIIDDTLKAFDDNVFKLDNDFDILIHDSFVEVLHPAGFIFISNLEDEILIGVNTAVTEIGNSIRFLNFQNIAAYVTNTKAKRAAKLLASIKSRNDLHLTDQNKLQEKCSHLGIPLLDDGNGIFTTTDDMIIDLLEVLDRRAYDYDITVNAEIEIYLASSRKKKN